MMKCKYCNSENLILEKRSKDDKHILDAQQVALICGDCGKYIKWCPKDERKFYWLNTNKKIGTINKIDEFDKLMAEYNCQDVYELVKAMQHQLAEKDKEIAKLKNFKRDINNALFMDAYDEMCGVDTIVLYATLKKDIRGILNEFDQIEQGEEDE